MFLAAASGALPPSQGKDVAHQLWHLHRPVGPRLRHLSQSGLEARAGEMVAEGVLHDKMDLIPADGGERWRKKLAAGWSRGMLSCSRMAPSLRTGRKFW